MQSIWKISTLLVRYLIIIIFGKLKIMHFHLINRLPNYIKVRLKHLKLKYSNNNVLTASANKEVLSKQLYKSLKSMNFSKVE